MTSIHAFSKTMPVRLLIGMVLICLMISTGGVSAQDGVRISPTPKQVKLPSAPLPDVEQQAQEAPTNTPAPTETEDPSVALEVKSDLGSADVRAMPEPDGEPLDPIKTGTRYRVTGRYYRWIQFEYEKSLTNRGWVFDELVDLTGSNSVPEIDPYSTPTVTPLGGNSEEMRAAVTLTPGAVETLDAQARVIAIPTLSLTGTVENAGPLPTFTIPAEVAPPDVPVAVEDAGSNTFEETLVRAATGQIPPIVPILVLAGAGLLGMILSMWRR